jgi:mono/diheme cytochrome c family protein
MTEPEKHPAAIRREQADPSEQTRPLPWIVTMLLGAMAMWGAFYIVITPFGEGSDVGDLRSVPAPVSPKVSDQSAAPAPDGQALFMARCSACHQANGQGVAGVFPPLAGSEWVLGPEKVLIAALLHGISGEIEVRGAKYQGAMPAFAFLSDAEIAAVATYIRSAWGNTASAVTMEQVAQMRAATRDRTEPYEGGEALKALQ